MEAFVLSYFDDNEEPCIQSGRIDMELWTAPLAHFTAFHYGAVMGSPTVTFMCMVTSLQLTLD